MSIEIIGMVETREVSESRGSFDGPQIDASYLACGRRGGTLGMSEPEGRGAAWTGEHVSARSD